MMLNDADKAAVDKVCSQARSCTVIVVSGRPLQIDPAQLNETTRSSPPGCPAARATA